MIQKTYLEKIRTLNRIKRGTHSGFLIILITFLGLSSCKNPSTEHATPQEVVTKVKKAAQLLKDQGMKGLEVLRDGSSEFSWKDTYVFSFNCAEDKVLANPAFPDRVGGDIKQHTDFNGFRYGVKMCEESGRPKGVWVEYIWPRPQGGDPMRKISYVMTVKSLGIQVGSGIYNETITLEELNKLIE